MAIIKNLIVEEFGLHIGKHSERVRVTRINTEPTEKVLDAPLLHLENIFVMSRGVSVSADVIYECARRGIPIHFLSGHGRHYAGVYSSGLVGTVKTRRAQLAAYEDGRGLAVTRALIAAKVENQSALLRYMAKYRKEREPEVYKELRLLMSEVCDPLGNLAQIIDDAGRVADVRTQLMNLEARGAQKYWRGVKLVVDAAMEFPGRVPGKGEDVLNRMLDYGYGVLYSAVERALLSAGLDPYAGFLHADRSGKVSLVYDLVEPFRTPVVDRALIALLNKGPAIELNEHNFFDDEDKRLIAEKVLARLDAPEKYAGKRHAVKHILQMQARDLAAYLRGDREEFVGFAVKW